MNIGQWIYDLFGSDGATGLLLVIFLIFLLDAFLFPTLPELFFVLAYMANAEGHYAGGMTWGCCLVMTAVVAEIIGIGSLYLVVKRIKIPDRIEKAVSKYADFLVLGDERLLLLNRVAPMVPFAGAFIAIAGWDIRRSMAYVVVGCVLKYGLLAILSGFFYVFFSGDLAQWFTLIMIIAVMAVSLIASFAVKKRKMSTGGDGE